MKKKCFQSVIQFKQDLFLNLTVPRTAPHTTTISGAEACNGVPWVKSTLGFRV